MTEQRPLTTDNPPQPALGVAGRMAQAFIHSPLSPLLYIAMLFIGLMGLSITPRQEDPQISVPMVDIFVQYPGADAEQVANLAIDPLQRIVSEVPGVEHVYSASERGQGIVTVQFEVGEELENSIFKIHDKLQSNMEKIPPGVLPPLVKPKGIDDVPVVTLTLWSEGADEGQLRALAFKVMQHLKGIPDTGQSFIVGGRVDQVLIEIKPERLSGFGISLGQVAQTIQTANSEKSVGYIESDNTHYSVHTGRFLHNAHEVEQLVVGTYQGTPVYVRDVAEVTQGPAKDPSQIVNYFSGPAYNYDKPQAQQDTAIESNGAPAVTIAIAKKIKTNGVDVANAILAQVEALKGEVIHDNVHVEVTRNYGQTANDKVNSLIIKLLLATAFVTVLVFLTLGWRPSVVVTFVIPVVILVTVFSAWILGYTIDRVSLFALIFSIGILVDDAIVVIENIYRRWLLKGETDTPTAVDAVREVGNPTILATFTVVAALLPMGFVSGMMGPYMEPIPALGSVAMVFSLFAAFIFTPWLAMFWILKPSLSALQKAEHKEHRFNERLEGFYRKLLPPLFTNRLKGNLFLIGLIIAFFASCAMFYTKHVEVKMLPLDNKPEFNVFIDMPEGTTLFETANLTRQLAERLRDPETFPEVTALQTYVGTSQPFDFNGMVRHYYLREKPWHADIHVQLKNKKDRHRSSHEIAVAARQALEALIEEEDAVNITIVEMPPGPPVLQSVVAEVYGLDDEIRREVAQTLTGFFEEAKILDDVDNYIAAPYSRWHFEVDTEKAVQRGISVDTINQTLAMALGGFKLGDIKRGTRLEPTYIVIQVPLAERAQLTNLYDLPIPSQTGGVVPLAELGKFEQKPQGPIYYQKDLRPVEYVVGDSVGWYDEAKQDYRESAPIYAMLEIEEKLQTYTTPDGINLATTGCHRLGFLAYCDRYVGPPETLSKSGIEWTGEWTVTYETFRDMGIAFAAALVLIYILVVWLFGNFIVPAVIMVPIPLTLLGIIPGHWLLDAEFTATSMIGWIALAGIIVRNSILLVDYSIHEIQQGTSIQDAVILACKTRTRPILITAFALVLGSSVIITDPIFQGMAISLLFGVLVSTLLTLVVIPLGCISIGPEALCATNIAGDNGTPAPNTLMEQPVVSSAPAMPLWLRVWSGVITVVLFLISMILGIVERIKAVFRAIISPTTVPPTATQPVATPARQDTAPAASVTIDTAPADTTPASQPENKAAAVVTTPDVSVSPTDTSPSVEVEKQPSEIISEKGPPKADNTVSETTDTAKPESVSSQIEQKPAEIKKQSEAKIEEQADTKAVTPEEPVTKAPAQQDTTVPTTTDHDEKIIDDQTDNEQAGTPSSKSTKSTPAKTKSGTTAAKKKTTSRRGIRIKTDLNQKDDKKDKDK